MWKVNDESSNLPRFQAVTRFLAHNKYVTRCLLSPDTRYESNIADMGLICSVLLRYLATCSADTTVKIWSISPSYDFKQEKILIGHQRWVWDCAFSADSAYLVTGKYLCDFRLYLYHLAQLASSDHTARLWEMSSGETVRQYNGHHKGRHFSIWFYYATDG